MDEHQTYSGNKPLSVDKYQGLGKLCSLEIAAYLFSMDVEK